MKRLSICALLLIPACRDTSEDSGKTQDSDTAVALTDADGDGFSLEEDCNDSDASVNPDAREVCDDLDNDCDGLIDDEDNNVYGVDVWYLDADADGYGQDSLSVESCTAPDSYVDQRGDCNDLDAGSHPDAIEVCDGLDNDCDSAIDEEDASDALTWFEDNDGDGYGTTASVETACDPPAGYALHDGDCDDENPAYHPGALEADCSDANDYNCDGSTGYADADADGLAACEDCDDSDAAANDDATEICDGVDNDCDGDIDSEDGSVEGTTTFYGDADGDGYGGLQFQVEACELPVGFVTNSDDCNDVDATSYPGASEVCDGADNDCDGDIDEGIGSTWYEDSDSDGYGNGSVSLVSCDAVSGYVSNQLDCDDFSASTNPSSYEVCDGSDNDCDGSTDEDAINASTWYVDGDSDGYGTTVSTVEACEAPTGHAGNATDCDDGDSGVNPGAAEACDGLDNNCDGSTDEGVTTTYYADSDSDGYGDASSTTEACSLPANGYVTDATDCDDAESASYPGNTEACDGLDNNCDGSTDEGVTTTYYADVDSDGYGDATSTTEACSLPVSGYVTDATDCDDSASGGLYNPGATESCGDPDYNCDNVVPPVCPYAVVTLTENQGVQLTDYAVWVDISAHSAALSSGFSITDSSGSTLDYCFEVRSGDQEGECTSSYTDYIWVKVPSLSASSTADLSIQTGSSTAGTGLDVFEVYEDFQDTTEASGISGWSGDIASGFIEMGACSSCYVGLNGSGLTPNVHKKIDYYQGTWSGESDLTLWLNGSEYGGDIDVYSCPGQPSGARSWTIVKTNELSYQICGSSGGQPGPFSVSVGSSFEYQHQSNDTDSAGMTLNWISMRPYVDNEPSSVVTAQ